MPSLFVMPRGKSSLARFQDGRLLATIGDDNALKLFEVTRSFEDYGLLLVEGHVCGRLALQSFGCQKSLRA